MGILDDTTLFTAIIQYGGFSHAAKHLGISNGLVSRRIAQLESALGVTLIKRTTRQIQLTPEGEIFWQHAKQIQQELDAALSMIQASSKKPKGNISVSAPFYFGRHYLAPIIRKFMTNFSDIKINLMLSNAVIDPLREQIDLSIRGAGYVSHSRLKDSSLKMKLLLSEKIGLYASPDYLKRHDEPITADSLSACSIVNYVNNNRLSHDAVWKYQDQEQHLFVSLKPAFSSNDIETTLATCIAGYGISRFTQLNVKDAVRQHLLVQILTQYDWGDYHLFAIYPQQKTLPKRTRLLLEYISTHVSALL